jgi:Glucodextranase, domain B
MEDRSGKRRRIRSQAAVPKASRGHQTRADGMDSPLSRLTLRRIGVVAVVAVLGVSVLLANGLTGGGPTGGGQPAAPAATASPISVSPASPTVPLELTEAPVLQGPDTVYTNGRSWTGRVSLSPTQVPRGELGLRILRDGSVVRDVDITHTKVMSVSDIALKVGANAIAVAYIWNGTPGPASNTVTVTRDGSAPTVDVSAPLDDEVTSASSVTVTGRTEGGTSLHVHNTTAGTAANATAGTDGTFSVSVPLIAGDNTLVVTATDPAGNSTTVQRSVKRDPDASDLEIELSHKSIKYENLPVSLDVTAVLTNGLGAAADGSVVTFSISPPGVPASIYQTKMQSAQADWSGAVVPVGAQPGSGFVTAKMTLPNGKTYQTRALFCVTSPVDDLGSTCG